MADVSPEQQLLKLLSKRFGVVQAQALLWRMEGA
jgi:hypothetical protein